jgi:hypothetical protein
MTTKEKKEVQLIIEATVLLRASMLLIALTNGQSNKKYLLFLISPSSLSLSLSLSPGWEVVCFFVLFCAKD